ncbi:uncharacterized protein LOC143039821 [Oratosquilla oratoria]|uniref:uncharacterized protein LOC143039821 n=1 Tax=Oratosquilla oratoria TaxID=337810 RepID=UPI003F75E6D2
MSTSGAAPVKERSTGGPEDRCQPLWGSGFPVDDFMNCRSVAGPRLNTKCITVILVLLFIIYVSVLTKLHEHFHIHQKEVVSRKLEIKNNLGIDQMEMYNPTLSPPHVFKDFPFSLASSAKIAHTYSDIFQLNLWNNADVIASYMLVTSGQHHVTAWLYFVHFSKMDPSTFYGCRYNAGIPEDSENENLQSEDEEYGLYSTEEYGADMDLQEETVELSESEESGDETRPTVRPSVSDQNRKGRKLLWKVKKSTEVQSLKSEFTGQIYSGKGKINPVPGQPDINTSGNIVLDLLEPISRDVWHKVYFDNWFNGLSLQTTLWNQGICCLGTVRLNRLPGCQMPTDVQMKKDGRGTSVIREATIDNVELRAVKWFDSRGVTVEYSMIDGLCGEGVEVIHIVSSDVEVSARRRIARETWATPGLYKNTSIKTIFMVGTSSTLYYQRRLYLESKYFRDVVQVDFMDNNQNQTLKTLAALYWTHKFCSKAKWLVKTESNIFLNPFAIQNYLKNASGDFVCRPSYNASVCRPGKCKRAEVELTEEEYAGNVLPLHCTGNAYIVNTRTIPALLKAHISYKNYFSLEDVYFTGILPKNASYVELEVQNFPLQPKTIFKHHYNGTTLFVCDVDKYIGPGSTQTIWDMILDFRKTNLSLSNSVNKEDVKSNQAKHKL